MHSEVLSEQQMNLLPLVGAFGHEFGLVGGTAVALHIGHRESIVRTMLRTLMRNVVDV